jgi:ribosomal protein L37AE/L43A
VTSAAISKPNGDWIISQLYKNLSKNKIDEIPFNYGKHEVDWKLLKHKTARKQYKCKNCGYPILIGNCGRIVTGEFKCGGCDHLVGGTGHHRPNSNTVEMSLGDFNYFVQGKNTLYGCHGILTDKRMNFQELPVFGFRLGHLLTHCLYAGLALVEVVNIKETLLKDVLPNNPYLNNNSPFFYFYKHVQCDVENLQKILRVNELPIDFLNYILQEIVANPGEWKIGHDLTTNEKNFSSHVEKYQYEYNSIRMKVQKLKKSSISQKTINEDSIKRKKAMEPFPKDLDKFLFFNLRQTKHLNLMMFQDQLEQRKGEFQKLEHYLHYIVRLTNEVIVRICFLRDSQTLLHLFTK